MGTTEIYINGQLCDSKNTLVSETKQINNFFEIKDRQTSFTNNFNLPMTPNNKRIMEYFGVVGASSNIPYQVNNVDIYRNGVPTIEDGKAFIQECIFGNVSYYKLNVQSDNINFYDDIAGLTLSDLSIGSHILNRDTFEASLKHTWEDGYTYQLMDSGYPIDDNVINANYIPVSFFYRYIWDKIWSDAGYEYYYRGKKNVFESNDFLNRTFTVDKSIKTIDDDLESKAYEEFARYNFNQQIDLEGGNLVFSDVTENFIAIEEDSLITNDGFSETSQISGVYTTEFVPDQDGFYRFIFDLDNSYPRARLIAIKNDKEYHVIGSPNSNGLETFNVYLENNDSLFFTLETTEAYSISGNVTVSYRSYSTAFDIDNYLESVKQKDFVKSVMQDYGLIHQKEKDGRYSFISLNDLFYDNEDIVDWSSKFDKKLKLNTKLPFYGQENYLRYEYEEDATFADGSFVINNETLPEESTMFKSIMRASRPSARFAQISMYGINFWERSENIIEDEDGNEVTEYAVTGNGERPYTFLTKKSSVGFNYSLNGEQHFYLGDANTPVFKNLTYNLLIAKYYNIYTNVLDRFEKYEVYLNLSAIDIYNMDFFKLYYIDELGANFYVNKISGFKNGKVTKVELVKVDVERVKGEHNNDFNSDFTI